jgi:hypothetical protein
LLLTEAWQRTHRASNAVALASAWDLSTVRLVDGTAKRPVVEILD